jgi:thiol-disulfide isomerase/thioredoxin
MYKLRLSVSVVGMLFATTAGKLYAAPPPGTLEELKSRIEAPVTQMRDDSGKLLTLNSFKGSFVVLNLWATWCAPCIKELPSLDRLATLLPANRFLVVIVNQDKGGAAVAGPFLDKLGMRYLKRLADPSAKLSRDLSVRGLPTTVIISPTGHIIARLEGTTEWDDTAMVSYLKQLAQEN